MNIKETLNQATYILEANKISNPYLDSEILLSKSINKDKKYIILNPKELLKSNQLNSFNRLIERRKKGEPIAYLINKKDFWKNEFYVNKDVLIPRPDTETLVDQILKIYSNQSKLQILDI